MGREEILALCKMIDKFLQFAEDTTELDKKYLYESSAKGFLSRIILCLERELETRANK